LSTRAARDTLFFDMKFFPFSCQMWFPFWKENTPLFFSPGLFTRFSPRASRERPLISVVGVKDIPFFFSSRTGSGLVLQSSALGRALRRRRAVFSRTLRLFAPLFDQVVFCTQAESPSVEAVFPSETFLGGLGFCLSSAFFLFPWLFPFFR